MSYHDEHYLNAGNILIGGVKGLLDRITLKPLEGGWRGPAWWFNQKLEDPHNPTHFPSYIPLSLVKEKLFGWTALESAKLVAHVELSDGRTVQFPITDYKAIIREDRMFEDMDETGTDGNPEAVLSVMNDSWEAHQPKRVFIDNMAEILQGTDNIGVTSAGLLKWGRIAWMEVSIPQELHNDKVGFTYRPNLLASTAFDGSGKTRYTRTTTSTVCDNTLQWALREAGDIGYFELSHRKGSENRLIDAAKAVGIIERGADDFDKLITEWSQTPVTNDQFMKWLDEVLPVPEVKVIDGKTKTNSQTIILNRRERIGDIYWTDHRAATWVGTKLGVAQAWNTFQTHDLTVKGAKSLGGNKTLARVEANQLKAIRGDIRKSDDDAMAKLDLVLSNS